MCHVSIYHIPIMEAIIIKIRRFFEVGRAIENRGLRVFRTHGTHDFFFLI